MTFIVSCCLSILLGVVPGAIQANESDNNFILHEDLGTVINLAAYPCQSITGISLQEDFSYLVDCSAGMQYQVLVREQREVIVNDMSESQNSVSQDDMNHDEFMLKQFFSIINLVGHSCNEVLSYEHQANKGSVVTCENQKKYQIQVTAKGRVTVDGLPTDT